MRLVNRFRAPSALVGFALVLIAPGPARAQGLGPSGGGPSPRVEEFRETLTILMMTRMKSELNLTKDQSEVVFPKIEDLEKSRQESAQTHRHLAMSLKTLLLDPSAKDADFARIVDTLTALDEADRRRDQAFFTDVRKILSPRQQAQFLDFRQRFRGWLEERMRDMRGMKPPMGQRRTARNSGGIAVNHRGR